MHGMPVGQKVKVGKGSENWSVKEWGMLQCPGHSGCVLLKCLYDSSEKTNRKTGTVLTVPLFLFQLLEWPGRTQSQYVQILSLVE